MTLIIEGHEFHYEMENLCRIFFPYEKIHVTTQLCDDILLAYAGREQRPNGFLITTKLRVEDQRMENSEMLPLSMPEREQECRMSLLLFELLVKLCGYQPKWGILTGIRPIKLLRQISEEHGEGEAVLQFREKFLVSKEKTQLSLTTMHNEGEILVLSRPESYSLYLSIPFCPTRCSYCSFVSQEIERAAKLIPQYVELLCEELSCTARIAKELGLRLESVYIGGGTPTTLSAEQLERLTGAVNTHFDLTNCREFTVEAGRPDTITPEKLDAMKRGGVTRISINPQTLNDEVLERIGRKHTAQQILDSFQEARAHGFYNINMDLIAGLPGDTLESFTDTMDRILQLDPECITVHTLALKRSSRIFQDELASLRADAETAARMLDYAGQALTNGGYIPYYLYRQSRMVGNLENTGWSKPGFESLYNVFIMDETHTILACGAGAVSKVKDPYSNDLERIFNFKYPYEYISRFPEMLMRKERVKEIYEKLQR